MKDKLKVKMLSKFLENACNSLENKDKLSALEIGTGLGNKSILLANKFKSYTGLEPNINYYNEFNKRCEDNYKIKIFNESFEKYASKTNEKFDILIFINSFQFINLEKIIENINKILNENGIIFIHYPHIRPFGWGSDTFNENSLLFNEELWIQFKENLIKHRKFIDNLSEESYLLEIIYKFKNKNETGFIYIFKKK